MVGSAGANPDRPAGTGPAAGNAAIRTSRRLLVRDPANATAIFTVAKALGRVAGVRYAARLARLMTSTGLCGAAALHAEFGDEDRARRCLRFAAAVEPGQRQPWHMLGLLPDADPASVYRAALFSGPTARQGLRLLMATLPLLRRTDQPDKIRRPLLRHLTSQMRRCFAPGLRDVGAVIAATRLALLGTGSRLLFEPEFQAAIAGSDAAGAASRFFDLARVVLLLEPGDPALLRAFCSLAWGPTDLDDGREAMAVDAFARCVMAGGSLGDGTDYSRYDLFRILTLRDQRQNHVPRNTAHYYALLANSAPILRGLPPAARRRAAGRRIGLYVGDLGSLTARCFAPGLANGLARHGFDCTIYTISPPGTLEGSALGRLARHLGIGFRHFDRNRLAGCIETVRNDDLALYVDMRGHSGDALPAVLAAAPAARTAYMIGTGETSGLPDVDFLVSDRLIAPDDREYRTERQLLRLDGGLLHFTTDEMPAEPLPERRGAGVRFGAFHQYSKINRLSVRLWAAALRHTPGSSLVLKFNTEEAAGAQRVLLGLLALEGIAPEHVSFARRTQTSAEHFALMREVDVLLDATPFNGETTTLEALWAGVPLVTVAGRRTIARYGLSILGHAGLGRLCAPSYDAFGETAAAAAADRSWLRAFRRDGRDSLMRTPTFNAELYGASIAAAFAAAIGA